VKPKITIAFRIGIGFGIIILAVIISAFLDYRNIQNIRIIQLIIAFIGVIITILLILSLVNPIQKIRKVLQEMSKGDLPDTSLPERADEVGQMATALNSLIRNLRSLSNFSQEIGKGNYNSDFQPLSEKDILGNSLLRMREDLKNAAIEEEKRKKEDEIRNWSTHGIARFSEILREYAGNFDELTFQIISNLVKYLEASAGGLFLIKLDNEGEKYLDLVASYAFDRRKYLKKQIRIGEGLAGRAMQEGESIYMTDIPGDYIKIKSGLGESRPGSLLIVPLKLNEEIHGVVEIASLKDFMQHQIEFVERICSTIASSLSSIKLMSKDDDLSPLSLMLSGDIPEDDDKIEQQIKKVHYMKEQLTKRENELKDRITDKKSKN
jgi:HAMP domain-containing protein